MRAGSRRTVCTDEGKRAGCIHAGDAGGQRNVSGGAWRAFVGRENTAYETGQIREAGREPSRRHFYQPRQRLWLCGSGGI